MAGNAEKIIELDRQRMSAMAAKDIAVLNTRKEPLRKLTDLLLQREY